MKTCCRFFILIILFSVFLFGCKTETPAAVPVSKPALPAPEKNTEISFIIEPEDFHKDKYGYMGIKYISHDQEKEKIKNRLEKKNAAAEDFEKAYKRIPEYGYIVLHIGRQDLMHANTKNYSGTVKKDNTIIYTYKGREGIPNIKGEDGNWWNIVKLPLRRDIETLLTVVLNDNKTGSSYSFAIKRVETVIK